MQSKILIGLTGGIGSGKSVACRYLLSSGYSVINADEETKKLYLTDNKLKDKLIREFGREILSDYGDISRDRLRNIIFSSKENLRRVNAVVHPFAIKKINSLAVELPSEIVFIESAILFESGYYQFCNFNILIYSHKYLRIERVARRDRVSRKSVERIISLQMPEKNKMRYADFIIYNNGSKIELYKAFKSILILIRYFV